MRAYNLVMLMVLVNAGMMVTVSMGMFGTLMEPTDSGWSTLFSIMTTRHALGPISFSGVEGLAILMTSLSVVANFIPGGGAAQKTTSGAGIAAFTIIFFSSLLITIGLFTTLSESIPGLDIFISIYSLIHFFIFTYALIQMTTGGAKANV
jgi:hypothetical protein